jgi:hypothetical protein
MGGHRISIRVPPSGVTKSEIPDRSVPRVRHGLKLCPQLPQASRPPSRPAPTLHHRRRESSPDSHAEPDGCEAEHRPNPVATCGERQQRSHHTCRDDPSNVAGERSALPNVLLLRLLPELFDSCDLVFQESGVFDGNRPDVPARRALGFAAPSDAAHAIEPSCPRSPR